MSAEVIMVASGKGGTGKSTVAVHVGAQLAAGGRKVLLIELDSGLRSVDYIAGVCGKTVYDIGDILSGRCDAAKAIVESGLYPGLFVVCAPYEGGDIRPEALAAFVDGARQVFSHVVLDTAAGMGVPFAAAKAVADRALLVVTPDPVALRDGRIVCDALTAGGCGDVRLVINRVPRSLAHTGIEDLDECIDTVGARLIGVVPESAPLAAASAHSAPLPGDDMAAKAFSAIAARLGGEQIPLVVR